MDLRPGGTYHYGMKAPDGSPMWGKLVYREIVPPERIVFINSFSDEAGGTHPPSDGADLAAGNALDLHLRGAAGRQDQVHRPLVAAQRDRRGAQDLRRRPRQHAQGWSGTMEQLDAYLAKAKA